MFATLLQDLKQPEYIHVLINPLPVYGLLTACLGLVIALFMRSRQAQVATLALIVLTAASAWPVAAVTASKATIASSPWRIPMVKRG